MVPVQSGQTVPTRGSQREVVNEILNLNLYIEHVNLEISNTTLPFSHPAIFSNTKLKKFWKDLESVVVPEVFTSNI